MKLDYNLYVHESDQAALAALKAIPGFSQLVKAFMNIWSEKQFKLENMSSNLRLGEDQMAKYYRMLVPICAKLEIEVPELYVKLDVNPNAYTYGDSHPFIVITSGMFETVPDELIPTVLAHECGHIACHHTLYHTMGSLLLSGALNFLPGIANIAMTPILLAFSYWMRCSEYSADRVAAVCDGSPDKTISLCMHLAGYRKTMDAEASVESFLRQAEDYRELVADSAFNKTLEFISYRYNSHPLTALRAYESRAWGMSDRFEAISNYLNNPSEENAARLPQLIAPRYYMNKDISFAIYDLQQRGFRNIVPARVTENSKVKPGTVVGFSINGNTDLKEDWYNKDSQISLSFYLPKTGEELIRENPHRIRVPEAARYFIARPVWEVRDELVYLGFSNIQARPVSLPKFSLFEKENNVARISIDNQSMFEKDAWFDLNAEVVLYYYSAFV